MAETDLKFYQENRKLLQDAQITNIMIGNKSHGNHVGLFNQGATCYLNSLIQCLFNDFEFKELIFKSEVGKSTILKELQKLFANLSLSDKNAVSTQSLIAAFGWTKMQMFEQHDIHEFFSVLVDALCQISEKMNVSVTSIFQGNLKGFASNSSKFSDIFILNFY
jgi:ubiquitin carboxyl-terminal hydrolase 7